MTNPRIDFQYNDTQVYHIKAEDNIKKLANHLTNLVSDINK